jgi:signal peptidase II
MSSSRTWSVAVLACVAGLVGCDHATKVAAESALRDHAALPVVPGVVDLSYTENRGVAFSVLERLSIHPPAWVLVAVALTMTAVVALEWVRRRRARWPEHVGFALVVAGALGNAIDRMAHGHVVDFIHVRFWPVFNVADVLVVAGVAAILVARLRAVRAVTAGGPTVPSHADQDSPGAPAGPNEL